MSKIFSNLFFTLSSNHLKKCCRFLLILSLVLFLAIFSLVTSIKASAVGDLVFYSWQFPSLSVYARTFSSGSQNWNFKGVNAVSSYDLTNHISHYAVNLPLTTSATTDYFNMFQCMSDPNYDAVHFSVGLNSGKKGYFEVVTRIEGQSNVSLTIVSLPLASIRFYTSQDRSSFITADCLNVSSFYTSKYRDLSIRHTFELDFSSVSSTVNFYGFNFFFYPNINEDYNSSGMTSASYSLSFAFSDIVFSDVPLSPADIENAVSNGLIDASGGNDYSPVDNSSASSYDSAEAELVGSVTGSDFQQSSSELMGGSVFDFSDFGYLLSSARGFFGWLNGVIFQTSWLNKLLVLSAGLGSIAFIIGLTSSILKSVRADRREASHSDKS